MLLSLLLLIVVDDICAVCSAVTMVFLLFAVPSALRAAIPGNAGTLESCIGGRVFLLAPVLMPLWSAYACAVPGPAMLMLVLVLVLVLLLSLVHNLRIILSGDAGTLDSCTHRRLFSCWWWC